MKVLITFLVFFSFLISLKAQVSGLVTDPAGEPLAFASIYVEGTSRGTTSNLNGEYEIQVEPGDRNLVFQYVGYQSEILALETVEGVQTCLLYTSPSPRDATLSRMPSSA